MVGSKDNMHCIGKETKGMKQRNGKTSKYITMSSGKDSSVPQSSPHP